VYGALRHDLIILVSNSFVLGAVSVMTAVKLRSRRLTVGQVEFVVPGGQDAVAALESLVEIGPSLAADLHRVGISDLASLRETGTDEANRRLVEAGLQTGAHSRRAIQGAIAGEWGTVSEKCIHSQNRKRASRRQRRTHHESEKEQSSELIGRSS